VLGSVARDVATAAHCPVIVTGTANQAFNADESTSPVIVGVDGSQESCSAVRFAAEEAAGRQCPLIAAHIWCLPEPGGLTMGTRWSRNPDTAWQLMCEAAERVLAEALAGLQAQFPSLSIERRVIHSDDVAASLLTLQDETDAQLLVVGARGQGGLPDLLLGSVSRSVLGHADRPIAIMHGVRQPVMPSSA
jgi:nucleotide-binding universal stress UspA family protein